MDNWNLNNLLSYAFARTRERIVHYFLTVLITIPLYLIIFAVSAAGIFFIFKLNLASFSVFKILTAAIVLLFVAFISIYVSAWTELVKIKVLIHPEKIAPMNALKEVRPLIKGFVLMQIQSSLFHFWLLPLYLVTLLITPLLWSFWSVFTSFVYLEKRKSGLENIWYSRAMVKQKPGAILLRVLAIGFIIFTIDILIPNGKNMGLYLVKLLFSLVAYPFSTLFVYKIYQSLEEPKEVQPPYNWLIAGGIAWFILLIGALVMTIVLLLK